MRKLFQNQLILIPILYNNQPYSSMFNKINLWIKQRHEYPFFTNQIHFIFNNMLTKPINRRLCTVIATANISKKNIVASFFL